MANRVHPGELRAMSNNSSQFNSGEFPTTKQSVSRTASQMSGELPGMTHSMSYTSSDQMAGEFPRMMKPSMSCTSSQWSCEFPRTKQSPPPGTYVIQLPKDQIYRVPPPENARRFEYLSTRKSGRSRCRRLCIFFLAAVLLLAILAGITACLLILILHPELPKYSVQQLSFRGFDLTSSSQISPECDVRIRVQNPNEEISIYHEKGSTARVYREDVELCSGEPPSFRQPGNNATASETALKESRVWLTKEMRKELSAEEKKGRVAFDLRIRAPVKMEFSSAKSWTLTVEVRCALVVDKLTEQSNILSQKCHRNIDIW